MDLEGMLRGKLALRSLLSIVADVVRFCSPRESPQGNSGHMHIYLPNVMPLFAPTVNSYKRLVGTSGAGDGVLGTGTSGRAGSHDQSADGEREATRLEGEDMRDASDQGLHLVKKATARFLRADSVAREVFGDAFEERLEAWRR
ncbi:glutamine synthetase [Aspergillus terreus]|uniref:Glutamine synthetase n=1 Tax=Aspergillus terreus TaxID=33178 RepID=A0A8H3RE63_ASPTE|nr:glutamine synthetase [Aspergillus terreus]